MRGFLLLKISLLMIFFWTYECFKSAFKNLDFFFKKFQSTLKQTAESFLKLIFVDYNVGFETIRTHKRVGKKVLQRVVKLCNPIFFRLLYLFYIYTPCYLWKVVLLVTCLWISPHRYVSFSFDNWYKASIFKFLTALHDKLCCSFTQYSVSCCISSTPIFLVIFQYAFWY